MPVEVRKKLVSADCACAGRAARTAKAAATAMKHARERLLARVGISSSCLLICRRVAEPAWSNTNTFLEILFRSRDIQTKTARPDKMHRDESRGGRSGLLDRRE